ncbi:MAG: hypothetical protein J7K31_01960, partial [Candidatus Aenigmarchaeota archaeon]|nr:hypothetical protein [Candidatus Aenigmarchaeota archaeon]
CCEGLHEIASGRRDGVVYCTSEVCGNGKCTALENEWNCPQDCGHTNVTISSPDLVIAGITWAPTIPTTGENIVFKINIENIGYASTRRGVWYRAKINGTTICDRKYALGLSPGELRTMYCSLAGSRLYKGLPPGEYEIIAEVDYNNQINERNENNNEMHEKFFVYGGLNCTDSDGGKNYYVKGTVKEIGQGRFRVKSDTCLVGPYGGEVYEGDYLSECYCERNHILRCTSYECPNGCRNGACLRDYVDIFIKPEIQYVDLDKGAKYVITVQDKHPRSAKSVTENKTQTVPERLYTYSLEVNSIPELKMIYDKKIILSTGEKKDIELYVYEPDPKGGRHSIKADVYSNSEPDVRDHAEASLIVTPAPRVCTDSDGGKNYYVKGTVIDKYGNKFTDHCKRDLATNTSEVVEYYCLDNQEVGAVVRNCPNGCKDGACLREESEVDPTELLEITIKLEQTIIKVHKVKDAVEAIADYYESISSPEAEKWKKAAVMLEDVLKRLKEIKYDIKNVETQDQLESIKEKIEDVHEIIEKIIRLIIYS